MSQQIEEPQIFDEKILENLIKIMGFNECIYMEDGAKQMLVEIGNDFLQRLLEESLAISLKRYQPFDESGQKVKKALSIDDVKYVLKNKMRVPVQNFQIERDPPANN